jgi:signal transduction histidine kinase
VLVRDKARGHCTLTVRISAGLPELSADKRLIKQILLNLLSNAIKFTLPGGEVTISAERCFEGIVVRVTDTGVGMGPEELKTAFSPYGQIDSKIARLHKGTGLGLPISRGLAELHGGTLTATSIKGVGTSMIFLIPNWRVIITSPATGRVAGL